VPGAPAPSAGAAALSAPDGEVAWAARAFLVLGDDGRIQEDYQLTVKALAA
jgi:hypothetical protein